METLLPYYLDFEADVVRAKDPAKAKAFWLKAAWSVENCHEAAELFPDMQLCPVCHQWCDKDGVLMHTGPAKN